jgi:hypothetical protein
MLSLPDRSMIQGFLRRIWQVF